MRVPSSRKRIRLHCAGRGDPRPVPRGNAAARGLAASADAQSASARRPLCSRCAATSRKIRLHSVEDLREGGGRGLLSSSRRGAAPCRRSSRRRSMSDHGRAPRSTPGPRAAGGGAVALADEGQRETRRQRSPPPQAGLTTEELGRRPRDKRPSARAPGRQGQDQRRMPGLVEQDHVVVRPVAE